MLKCVQQMKKSRIAEALEWMRDPMKVRGIATDRDVLKIQRKLEVDCHRAAKIVSRAELALRWTYIRDTEEKDKKIREARNNIAKTQREKEEKLRQRAQQAQSEEETPKK